MGQTFSLRLLFDPACWSHTVQVQYDCSIHCKTSRLVGSLGGPSARIQGFHCLQVLPSKDEVSLCGLPYPESRCMLSFDLIMQGTECYKINLERSNIPPKNRLVLAKLKLFGRTTWHLHDCGGCKHAFFIICKDCVFFWNHTHEKGLQPPHNCLPIQQINHRIAPLDFEARPCPGEELSV